MNAFLGKVVTDVGSAMSAALVVLGDQLGLWRALARAEKPLSPAELAHRTETNERYIREWLNAMAAGGYVTYCQDSHTYRLEPEQAVALADSESPAFVPGLFQVTAAMWAAESKIAANFRSGNGLPWGHHHPCLFEGTERFFRSGYLGNLIQSWLPALDGVVAKLERGASVADVGCGVGASTIIMAKAYPASRFVGFDSHAGSIELARQRAREAGVADRVTFEVASATDFPGSNYDLIAHFDCFHDLEDPRGAAKRAREAIAPDGTWLLVEPFASDRPEHNHNPVGRVFYSASTMLCVPHSLSQGGPALGAQAGEAKLGEQVKAGGWTQFRRATETPFNLVLEARP
ncbi:MAG TPA: class I SAM-dependent methyltransferase [Kofleriaceae bacterium]|nr:class I SAM-dependent methyltransferase [Kofleriaceae bacterium]